MRQEPVDDTSCGGEAFVKSSSRPDKHAKAPSTLKGGVLRESAHGLGCR